MRKLLLNKASRTGFSFLELQVAFVLLAIALAGLGPLVVMQSRQLRKIEGRLAPETTHYLVPPASVWARKLGASATLQTQDPGSPLPPVTLIDDGDPGYSEIDVGTLDWWTEARPHAYQFEVRRNNGGGIGDTAIWEFTGVEPGRYEVLVTYEALGYEATDAPYSVYDDTILEGTVRVRQKSPPSGPVFDGVPWESLGVFSIVSGTLRVELSDDANGVIVADAVRIVPVRNDVQVISLEKSLTGEALEAHVSVTEVTGGG